MPTASLLSNVNAGKFIDILNRYLSQDSARRLLRDLKNEIRLESFNVTMDHLIEISGGPLPSMGRSSIKDSNRME